MDGLEFLLDDDYVTKIDNVSCGVKLNSYDDDDTQIEAIDDGTWDDVLNAFDAYCRGDEETTTTDWNVTMLDNVQGSGTHALARQAVNKHIAQVLSDAIKNDSSSDTIKARMKNVKRETKRREADDSQKTITYVRSKVNSYLRLNKMSLNKVSENRLSVLRDMFVAEFRSFDERSRDIERRGVEASTKTSHLCLNLPDAGEIMRRKFKASRVELLNAFDTSFNHITSKVISAPASTTSSACKTTTATNSNTAESESDSGARHTKHARKVLSTWLWDHFYPTETRLKPIPTREEKEDLARQTGLTPTQVGDWFVNARARLWKPYIEGLVRGVYNDAMVKKALDLQAEVM
jgi:hypothetical protein